MSKTRAAGGCIRQQQQRTGVSCHVLVILVKHLDPGTFDPGQRPNPGCTGEKQCRKSQKANRLPMSAPLAQFGWNQARLNKTQRYPLCDDQEKSKEVGVDREGASENMAQAIGPGWGLKRSQEVNTGKDSQENEQRVTASFLGIAYVIGGQGEQC